MSDVNYYMAVLSALPKNKLESIKTQLKDKLDGNKQYNNVMEGYFKNKEYQQETINLMKQQYQKYVKPYKEMKTQLYRPTQMEKRIIQITNQSYKLPEKRINIDNYKYLDKLSTKQICVYQYKTLWTHKIIIAFRGSKDREDLVPDFYIIKNRHSLSSRFENSLQKCDKIQQMFPDAQLYLTGHSLGGTISIWIRQKRNYCHQCYAFSPGYNGVFQPKLRLKYKNLKIIMVKGDVISNTLLSLNQDQLPEHKNLIIIAGKDGSPIQNHKFQNYMYLLEQ